MTLRVTIEIVPFGNEDEKKELFRFNIHNTGQTGKSMPLGLTEYSYSVDVTEKGEDNNINLITVHSHVRRDGAVELARKVLEKFVNEEFNES